MKKFLIGIIIVLTILLIGQLIYFNYRNNYYLNNTAQNNEISENILNNNANGVTTNLTNNFETNITTEPNVITPNGMSTIAQNYTGEVRLSEVEEAFYTFVHTNINEIYQLVQKKSINQILQQYDLNTSKINSKLNFNCLLVCYNNPLAQAESRLCASAHNLPTLRLMRKE